jgi:muramoyltetrapeptide carboxypeptidase
MTRRQALAGWGAAFAQGTRTAAIMKPRALREGDTIGLITPATYVSDPDRLVLAEKTLRYFKLKPRFGKHVGQRAGYLGGSVEDRLSDLHAMFADPEVNGIFCVRGGYGSAQLLDRIDYDLIHRNPKVFLGYSDITSLHLAIHRRTGLVTFHGPIVLSKFPPYTQEHFRRVLFEPKPAGAFTNPPESNTLRPEHILRTVRSGRARGPLIGGNLSVIAATMGTPFEVNTRNRILFIEDVDEQPYAIDRMLTQLRLAGKLEQAAGIIFGECEDCRPRDYKPSFESTFSLGEVVDRILGGLKIPVLYGLTIGHTDDQLTLPEGIEATLDADKGELILEEAAVIS